jgi:HEAT repeat protein
MLARPEVRDRAIGALAVVPDERIDGLLSALEVADAEVAASIVTALVRLRRPSAHAALASALAFDNVTARRAAAVALASLGTPAANEALARVAATDPDPEIRRLAQSAG